MTEDREPYTTFRRIDGQVVRLWDDNGGSVAVDYVEIWPAADEDEDTVTMPKCLDLDRSTELVRLRAENARLQVESTAYRRLVRELAATDPMPDRDLDGEGLCQWCGEFMGHRRLLYYDSLTGEPRYEEYPPNDPESHRPDCLWRQAVELSAQMAPGWEPDGTPAGDEEGA